MDFLALAIVAAAAIGAVAYLGGRKPPEATGESRFRLLEMELEKVYDQIITWRKRDKTREARETTEVPENGAPPLERADRLAALRASIVKRRLKV